eukprot:SAG31_NODE_1239_length_9169_cov_18.922492_6_plen_84_part_00
MSFFGYLNSCCLGIAMSALEFSELLQQCRRAKSFLQEALIEQKFRLRLKILEYAAFKGLFPYRPRVLMMQVAPRVCHSWLPRT